MALADKIVVSMNRGVTLDEICAWVVVDEGSNIERMVSRRDCFDGFSHLVAANRTSNEI